MRYIIIAALCAIMLGVVSRTEASDYAVKFLNNNYTTSNSYSVLHRLQPDGPVSDIWRWIPLPRQSDYDGIFDQYPVGTATVDTNPPAEIYQMTLGVWVHWPGQYDFGDVLTVRLDATVNVTSHLAGIQTDVILDNPDSWTDFTARVQQIPEVEQIARQLRDNYASGTCRGVYGVVERMSECQT